MLINVSLMRPSACISMTILESDSCKEIVHRLRIYLTLSLISAQYTLEFSVELKCSALKCPTHTTKIKLSFNTLLLPEKRRFSYGMDLDVTAV